MRKAISREYLEKIAEEKGFLPAPPDHPIYTEGSSIMFLHRTAKQFQAKATDFQRKNLKKHEY